MYWVHGHTVVQILFPIATNGSLSGFFSDLVYIIGLSIATALRDEGEAKICYF